MARRILRPHHQEDIRAKIKGAQLAEFLTELATTGLYRGNEVNPVRVTAAVALLRKVVPDLAATDMTITNRESWSESLQRIADARKADAVPADIIPLLKDQA
jgi:hypothetical protein